MTGADATSPTCPRCRRPLEQATLRQSSFEACKACNGALVAQPKLAPLLDALSAPLLRSFDLDAEIEATKNPAGSVDCPRCARQMDRDDYCAAGVVFFDRCSPCALLWFDADELGAMSLMWTRMNGRRAREEVLKREVSRSARLHSLDRSYLSKMVFGLFSW